MSPEVSHSFDETEYSGYKEIPEEDQIPYAEFLKGKPVEVGKMIIGVKPKDLFTYQKWIDDNKIMNVMGYVNEGNPLLHQITGYIHHHTKFDKDILVVGNGNHRALYALLNRLPINVEIKEHPEITADINPFRITNNAKRYGDRFGGL